jgi:tRNA (guanine-N7-)-methyltransferase
MARTKLKRLDAIKELNNVFSFRDPDIRKTLLDYFSSSGKFTVEIGCGHGDYSVELAKVFPDKNFVGIDVKAARVYHGALRASINNLPNVAFVISRAEKLCELFPQKSLEEIYIPFPDPHLRRANHNRRLITHDFLQIYSQLLLNNGRIHFKTDNSELYEYALKIIKEFGCKVVFNSSDLYAATTEIIGWNVKTSFESHYIKKGRGIYYICFQF